MALLKPNEPIFMTAEQAATRRGYAARAELALRNSLEAFCRKRWPDARVCHEMMMGERRVRADVVAVDQAQAWSSRTAPECVSRRRSSRKAATTI